MQLRPFKELIAMSKENLDEAMAPIRAKQVKSKAELEMAVIDGELLTLEREIHEMCIEKDIDFKLLCKKMDNFGLLERRKKQYQKILSQLFP